MTLDEAKDVIQACAEADYSSVDAGHAHPREFHRDTLRLWSTLATRDDVKLAIETLGIEAALDVYIKALDDEHDQEYGLDGEENE